VVTELANRDSRFEHDSGGPHRDAAPAGFCCPACGGGGGCFPVCMERLRVLATPSWELGGLTGEEEAWGER
jgi:hypothetical protein